MRTRKFSVVTLTVLMLSLAAIAPTYAVASLDLPTDPVGVVLTHPGLWPGSVALSGIVGDFDVSNSPPSYTAWCVQFDNIIVPSVPYTAYLVSTLGMSSPWPEVNYLINTYSPSMNTQVAIWRLMGTSAADIAARYTEGVDYDISTVNAMIAAAQANSGFVPVPGQLVAIICETLSVGGIEIQDLIIEVEVPEEETPCGLSPGFWKHNIAVYLGENPGSYSVPHDGEPRIDGPTLEGYLADIGVSAGDAYAALTAKGKGSAEIRLNMANLLNDAAGYAPYSD